MAQDTDVKEQIQKLIKLQELDAEKFDLQFQIESVPKKMEDMNSLLNTKETEVAGAEDELKKLQISRNEKETEMAAKEEKIEKHTAELYQIKSNKEYAALQQEIKSIQADVSLLEEEIINFLDKIEEVQTKYKNATESFEKEKQEVEKSKENIRAEEKKLSEKLAELDTRRQNLVREIEPAIFERYARILRNKGRVALTKINGNFCGECNMQLRPQIINEIKLRKNIVVCENCSRMLYAEE